jgi:Flp pilus assembly pilin Flp
MSFAPQDWFWLYDIPTHRLALAFVAVFVGFYWAGSILVRPILRQFVRNTAGANDIVGYVLSCFCVFYGLLLGLIAVTAYQNVSGAGETVTREAAALSALYFQPQSPAQEIVHAEALRQFNNFLEYRRMRLLSVNSSLPASMWYVMILGAVLNIAICWLFDMRFVTQLVLGGILAAYLGTMMFLIFDMNQPFRGDVSISPEAFETLYRRMDEE